MISILLILGLGFLVYSNTFHCPFNLDDFPSIVENFSITNIHHLKAIWDFWPCRFMTYLSFAFNYHLRHFNVVGYHIFNLAVHLISAVLVWWLVLLTFRTPVMKDNKITPHAKAMALFAALVFVAHPLQTEAVTYIVQRAASMASMFYLASLCFYVKSRLINKSHVIPANSNNVIPAYAGIQLDIIYYISSLLMAVTAMFTKEIAITLNCVRK